MINAKEFSFIIAVSIVLAFTISLVTSITVFLYTLLSIFLVLMINVIAKKVAAFFLETEIEVKLWEMKRWGYKTRQHFRTPVPMGVIMPIIVTIISYGYLNWFATLVFDVKQKVYRATRRWGMYTFSEVTEYHIGIIAAWGVVANLLFALIGYLIGFPEFARLNIYVAFFNLIPFSDLDGNKIFFGSIVLWAFLAAVALIALGYAIFLI